MIGLIHLDAREDRRLQSREYPHGHNHIRSRMEERGTKKTTDVTARAVPAARGDTPLANTMGTAKTAAPHRRNTAKSPACFWTFVSVMRQA